MFLLSDHQPRQLHASSWQRVASIPGDRVTLVLENCPEYLELLYASWHAGLVEVPVNAKLHRKEFDYILKNSEASLCFVSAKVRESVEPLLGDTLSAIVDLGSDEYTDLFKFAPCTMEARGADDAA